MKNLALILFIVIPNFSLFAGDLITGRACYKFSDDESIQVAKEIVFSMAKREALEGYKPFIEASSRISSKTQRNNIISSIIGEHFSNIQIIEDSKNIQRRKICSEITAEIESSKVKDVINYISGIERKIKFNIPSALWENEYLKWIKIEKINQRKEKYLKVRYFCKSGKSSIPNKGHDEWNNGSNSKYVNKGRDFKIVCIDKNKMPLSITKYISNYGCYTWEGDPVGYFYIPINVFSACFQRDAADYSFEWLDK